MIPKIIHYCWLSDDPLPKAIQDCIDSWRIVMPDYEIIKWDRNRFDINSVKWVKDAYAAKKYAFCADYIRMYALYSMGGIYLDSDVVVYKSFDPFLNHSSFTSFEFHSFFLYAHIRNKKENLVGIQAAILGSQKGEEWVLKVLNSYNNREFKINNSVLMNNTMPKVIARILSEHYGMEYVPKYQKLKNGLEIYPCEVFAAKETPQLLITYARHLGVGAWTANTDGILKGILRRLVNNLGLLKITRKIRGIGPHL